MRIDLVRIENFRGIAAAELRLDEKLTVLVGANNAGKTTVLDALAAVLTYRRGRPSLTDKDFRAEAERADIRSADPICITLWLVPTRGPRFESGEQGDRLPNVNAEGEEFLTVRLEVSYAKESELIDSTMVLLNAEGKPQGDELAGFPWRENLLFRAFAWLQTRIAYLCESRNRSPNPENRARSLHDSKTPSRPPPLWREDEPWPKQQSYSLPSGKISILPVSA